MTVEHHLVFDVSDIRRVILQCSECGARLVFPVGRELEQSLVRQCPSCRSMWFDPEKQTDLHEVFVRKLNKLREKEEEGYFFKIRFELDDPEG